MGLHKLENKLSPNLDLEKILHFEFGRRSLYHIVVYNVPYPKSGMGEWLERLTSFLSLCVQYPHTAPSFSPEI